MRMLDIFSGIGGFSLAGHWANWETAAFIELDEGCQKVLMKNFPGTPIYSDVKKFFYEKEKNSIGPIDIISGGFPCQPFSSAGKRKGRKDDRYLWPEMLRIISEVRPSWVVGENVTGILSLDHGRIFEEVCSNLESEGYTVEPYIIPACGIGAPHRRNRVWIIAHATGEQTHGRAPFRFQADTSGGSGTMPFAYANRFKFNRDLGGYEWRREFANPNSQSISRRIKRWGENWLQVAAGLCRVDDGIPEGLDKTRRLKQLGNSIVPDIAYMFFDAINQYENKNKP